MQFSCNFTLFWLFQPFLGQFQHVGYQKACTQAEKCIGGTDRGHRPQEGAEGPKKDPLLSARARLFGTTRQNILV